MDIEHDSSLYTLYDHYSRFGGDGAAGTGMSSRNFAKLMRDRGLLDKKKLTLTTIDLAYTKAAAGGKRISYEQFCAAVQLCAKAKDVSPSALVDRLLSAEAVERAPLPSGVPSYWNAAADTLRDEYGVSYHGVTKPQPTRFYDDIRALSSMHKGISPVPVPSSRGLVPQHIIARELSKRELPPPVGSFRSRRRSAAPTLGEHAAPLPHEAVPRRYSEAPSYPNTPPRRYNRLYDDRSTWTHLQKQGGPDHGPKRGSITSHWSGGLRQ